MPTIISIVSTKGGVGKTTTAANLAGILADFGMRVLLIDADVQPSLSGYYNLAHRAPRGLASVILSGGLINDDAISQTSVRNLDLIYSDVSDESIQMWLGNREDRLMILKRAVTKSPAIANYSAIIIDSQGAKGNLQRTAAMAATYMISPVKPDVLSAAEFATNTLAMLEEINRNSEWSAEMTSGPLFALINAHERTNNARSISDAIRAKFVGHPKVRVLKTVVPHAAAYSAATTARVPVHQFDRRERADRPKNSAWTVMHELVWELFPEIESLFVDDISAEDDGADHSDDAKGAVV